VNRRLYPTTADRVGRENSETGFSRCWPAKLTFAFPLRMTAIFGILNGRFLSIYCTAMTIATEGMSETECSSRDGICEVPRAAAPKSRTLATAEGPEVVYFGDPMCSWCWGISSQLERLHRWCVAEGIPFRLVMGGLRAGGGDAWDRRFRDFLRHHWQEVAGLTGQTFNTGLLDADSFEYDTEPACRAVVTARSMAIMDELAFFAGVQRGFYVDNEDPKCPTFHAARCGAFGLDPDAFVERFASDDVREATKADFAAARAARVTGFPTIALYRNSEQAVIATGFANFDDMRRNITQKLNSTGRLSY
jgi:putative protein-disulfide isomerase